MLDRSPAAGAALEGWLTDRAGFVTRTTDGCAFLSDLRQARHELVVLYAPTGAVPLSTQTCTAETGLMNLAAELSAVAYRRGSVLVLDYPAGTDMNRALAEVLGSSAVAFVEPDTMMSPLSSTTAALTLAERPLR